MLGGRFAGGRSQQLPDVITERCRRLPSAAPAKAPGEQFPQPDRDAAEHDHQDECGDQWNVAVVVVVRNEQHLDDSEHRKSEASKPDTLMPLAQIPPWKKAKWQEAD